MSKLPVHDEKPWEPTLDSLPIFNPFANPVEHLNDPESPIEVETGDGVGVLGEPRLCATEPAGVAGEREPVPRAVAKIVKVAP